MILVTLGWALLLTPVALFGYAFVVYPIALLGLAAVRRRRPLPPEPAEWPELTITVPVYNEATSIAATLDRLLGTDYPPNRRHILVVSDASTDGTDEIVAGFRDRGVRLLRLPTRSGKTGAENYSVQGLEGTIVVNTDATTMIPRGSLKALIRELADPSVGVSSGRDVSRAANPDDLTAGESGYVGFEMWLRRLETQVDGIVGASGCFYAIRRELFDTLFPAALSRDFASALVARQHGYRSVSAHMAVCVVPRSRSPHGEFRRKGRTMARGLETLWHLRSLLNPFRYGLFAWMLISHKLIRWLLFLAAPLAVVGCALLVATPHWPVGVLGLVGAAAVAAIGVVAYRRQALPLPPGLSQLGYAALAAAAGLHAWIRALRGELNPIWEPTRR